MVAGALYEGLYHFTPDGELVAALADGMPEVSSDGLVYTFTLKPGAMFAGPDFEPREVTADDVAYGMTRALDPTPMGAPALSWGSGYLLPIKGAAAFTARREPSGVTASRSSTTTRCQVTLEAPTSTFLLGLTIATSWPVPQEAVEARGEDFANRPVGAGPFFVKEWNKGSDITLVATTATSTPSCPISTRSTWTSVSTRTPRCCDSNPARRTASSSSTRCRPSRCAACGRTLT